MTRWLDVEVGTDDIDLITLPSNLALVDLQNDNEFKLVVGDLGRGEEGPKLKVFKGAMQISDTILPDLPLGVVGFSINESMPRSVPLIAVAYSSCVYMYRNLKIFYKYYLPSSELNMCEIEVWKQLTNPSYHNIESLQSLTDSLGAIPHKLLSPQSQNLLDLTPDQQLEYLENITDVPSKKNAEIVCITTLKLHSIEREKSVCILKRDWPEGRILFNTDEHIIAVEVVTADNSVMVICADNTLACYSKKGKKQWCLTLEHRPVAMTLVPVLHLGVTLTAVALATGHVHLYDGKARRDTIFVRDLVSVMKFGQLGQEEHVLIIVTGGGNLMLKILKRTADFSAHAAGVQLSPHAAGGQRPWLIPKKSKLFLEQSVRERENAVSMHQTFQHELNRLRLLAAKTLLEAHVKSDNSIGIGPMDSLRLTAEVEGLGPVFRVTLIIENTSKEKAVIGLAILFHVHTINYKVSNPYIKVPLLSPGGKLKFPTKIEEVFDDQINPDVLFRPVTGQGGERSLVKVLLVKEGKTTPILAATVQMPPTDPMMLPFDKMQAAAGLESNEDSNWFTKT
ncbi:unnamed protein product [Arctia plantaginis]|uniref:Bardet-Biedl syndrome 1 n=1 Tax=Arctia plantaginis TaxID=874455 RepID=A0A8S0ZRX9_ARCPL|nr:unnamed protein product [Arctia plantaginis]